MIVYDVNGRTINELVNGKMAAGTHSVNWNGKNRSGIDMPTGVYFARLTAGDVSKTIKMLLVR